MASIQSITFESTSLDLERRAQRQLEAIERLTAGKRSPFKNQTNAKKGEGEKPAIAARMDSVLKGLDSAKRNASDAFALLEFTNENLDDLALKAQAMIELAKSSVVENIEASTREALNSKFQVLASEFQNAVNNTSFRGVSVFSDNAASLSIVINPGAQDITSIKVDLTANIEIRGKSFSGSLSSVMRQIAAFRTIQGQSNAVFGNLLSSFEGNAALGNSGAVAQSILEIRAKSGSQMNRFYNVLESIEQLTQTTKRARAEFESTNYAKEIGEKTARMFKEFSEKSKQLQANLNIDTVKDLLESKPEVRPLDSSTVDKRMVKKATDVYSSGSINIFSEQE